MAIPNYEALMLPLLHLAAQREIKNADACEKLADEFGLSEEEREQLLPSGRRQTIISNRVIWAKVHLAKAGLLERSQQGSYRITERGREILNENPAQIDNQYLKRFPEFVEYLQARVRGTKKIV
ncbi:MAG: winged helix-turn-helix domain-containing protein, partial [Deltaproteobacteria bacterium]|nr:winged helix-turn-helix domain-containing protein [Deltaproteobacteria bacterium]